MQSTLKISSSEAMLKWKLSGFLWYLEMYRQQALSASKDVS